MASYTTNLNLKKPAGSENVAIGDINGNMDTIDTAYGTLTTRVTSNHYDTITGGFIASHGDIRIVTFTDSNASITTSGIKLIDKADYITRSICKYYDGSSNVIGFLKLETSGNDTYIFVTNMNGNKVNANYVAGQLVYTASSYNG